MKRNSENRIFGRTRAADFIGRGEHLEKLLRHAKGSGGLALLAAPSAGVSELLRQVYDRLFVGQDEVIPFYFEIRESDRTAQNTALRFLSEFLLQTVAYRRRDPGIIDASPDIAEIANLAVPADGYWIDRLVETYNGEKYLADSHSFIRNCLSSPLRAAASNARVFLMIDDLHTAMRLDGGDALVDDIIEIFGRGTVPFVLAGQRRFLFAKTPFETLPVEPFSFEDGGRFAEMLSRRTGTQITDQTRDLIAVQLGGNAGHITSLFASAAAVGNSLSTFEQVEQAYTDEIFGGRIGRYLDGVFDRIAPDAATQTRVLNLLSENLAAHDNKIPLTYWQRHAGIKGNDLGAVLDALNHNEIVSIGPGPVEFDPSNIVLADYIRGRLMLETGGDTRALVVGEALSDNVKRAPQLMGRFYRRNSALGLRELMDKFDGRQISPALIDYARFKAEFKGADDEKILKSLAEDNSRTQLPQIVFTAHTSALYPKLKEICDEERSATALGFDGSPDGTEIAWIAAEIDSKLEATRELAEFWCDRLEMAALSCDFDNYKIWLVAPEGFNAEAMEVLSDRNAFGSSRKQIDLMAGMFNITTSSAPEKAAYEYEIVVPMGDDTEMIAAHTIEEIAKKHNFPAKAINQIKTALVEACINATEHSLSPDKKIYQKFAVDADKITITVSNRGLRLSDKQSREIAPDQGRRGWGLKLMKGLMDEVRIEQTDDGTRIVMVKLLQTELLQTG